MNNAKPKKAKKILNNLVGIAMSRMNNRANAKDIKEYMIDNL